MVCGVVAGAVRGARWMVVYAPVRCEQVAQGRGSNAAVVLSDMGLTLLAWVPLYTSGMLLPSIMGGQCHSWADLGFCFGVRD